MSKPLTGLDREPPRELPDIYRQYPQLWPQRPTWPRELERDLSLGCGNCRMLRVADNPQASLAVWPRRDWGPFLESVKCCAHQPHWPNYLLGAALQNADKEASVYLDRLLQNSQLTPWGARPTSGRRAAEARSGQCGYGREAELACPLLNSKGQCSVWSYRPATCASYVCQSVRGSVGLSTWSHYESRRVAWESELAHQLVWHLGYTNDDLRIALDLGEATALYRRCHDLLRSGWSPLKSGDADRA